MSEVLCDVLVGESQLGQARQEAVDVVVAGRSVGVGRGEAEDAGGGRGGFEQAP